MKPNETIRMGVVALSGLVAGVAGCSRGPSDALCDDMHSGSRSVEELALL